MLPDEVRKAVEYVDQIFDDADNGEWATIKAHLLAREAEVEKCRRSVEQTQQWYAERFERLKDLGKEKGCWPEMAAIMANGSLTGHTVNGEIQYEPPTYAQQINRLRHRAERADALLREAIGWNWLDDDAPQQAGVNEDNPSVLDHLYLRITAHLSENSRG